MRKTIQRLTLLVAVLVMATGCAYHSDKSRVYAMPEVDAWQSPNPKPFRESLDKSFYPVGSAWAEKGFMVAPGELFSNMVTGRGPAQPPVPGAPPQPVVPAPNPYASSGSPLANKFGGMLDAEAKKYVWPLWGEPPKIACHDIVASGPTRGFVRNLLCLMIPMYTVRDDNGNPVRVPVPPPLGVPQIIVNVPVTGATPGDTWHAGLSLVPAAVFGGLATFVTGGLAAHLHRPDRSSITTTSEADAHARGGTGGTGYGGNVDQKVILPGGGSHGGGHHGGGHHGDHGHKPPYHKDK
jgi:hypothetical protein